MLRQKASSLSTGVNGSYALGALTCEDRSSRPVLLTVLLFRVDSFGFQLVFAVTSGLASVAWKVPRLQALARAFHCPIVPREASAM
jgi:hypothetical protein